MSLARLISKDEHAIIQWMLANAIVTGDNGYVTADLEALRVVGGCKCGCGSIEFAEQSDGMEIVADAVAVYPDGKQSGVILFGRDGVLVELEFYEMDPEASKRRPELSQLRTYDELGLTSPKHGAP